MPDLHRLPFYAFAGIQDLICKNYFTLPMRCQDSLLKGKHLEGYFLLDFSRHGESIPPMYMLGRAKNGRPPHGSSSG